MSAARIRLLTEQNIARNPSTIALVRTTVTPKPGGGQTKTTTVLDPQTMRIFLSSTRAERTVQEGGRIQVQQWGLLADRDADIEIGDEFTHEGRFFRVRNVLPVSAGGERTGYQAELEEVS